MLSINLETKLIANKRKVLSKEELFVLDKMSTLESMKDSDANLLKELGMWSDNIKTKNEANQKLNKFKTFRSDRVFHIKDIQKLCQDYGLRFLNSQYFNGELDTELPNKIRAFKKEYGIQVDKWNSYIVAPAKSFKLEKKPKDPLFFVHLGDDYYYLVHKWGKDISVFRWLANLPIRTTAVKLVTFAVIGFILGNIFIPEVGSNLYLTFILGNIFIPEVKSNLYLTILARGLMGVLITGVSFMMLTLIDESKAGNLWSGNNSKWDSKYL